MNRGATIGRLAGKVALISGAASSIGRATAVLFAQNGARAGIADIDPAGAEEAAKQIAAAGGEAAPIELDVAVPGNWDAAIGTICDRFGGLDVLVNCAGISDDAPLADLSLDQWRRVMAVNLDGVLFGTVAAIKAMKPARTGAIVNVSSLSGIKASAGAAAYCASKAAVIQLTKVAALECAQAGLNIRVNCVAPGGVKTPMWEKTPLWPAIRESAEWQAPTDTAPLQRFASPEEVAEAVLFLASDAASYISGAVLAIDGGASA